MFGRLVYASDLQASSNLTETLCRGMFRTSAEKWFNPDEVHVSESTSGHSGSCHARLSKTRSGHLEANFSVPAKLAPVYLAFKIHSSSRSQKNVEHEPARGSSHFAVPLGLSQSNPLLLGRSPNILTQHNSESTRIRIRINEDSQC